MHLKNTGNKNVGKRAHGYKREEAGKDGRRVRITGVMAALAMAAVSSFPSLAGASTQPQIAVPVASPSCEELALKNLGAAGKAQLEQLADQAEAPYTAVYWTIPDPENSVNPFIPNDGIPIGAIFYSSVDHVWEPLGQTEYYVNSVRQHGADTGTVYVSWSNGRGRFFPYTAAEYAQMTQVTEHFYQTYIKEDMSDFEKEMQIVQYLVANTEYPYARYLNNATTLTDHNAYGALVKGEAVCEGYTEAFCWLADRVGLQTGFLYGSSEGEGHDWNLVRLEDQWYHVDLTREDPVMGNGSQSPYGWGKLLNRYINLTDEQMRKDHNWDRSSSYPCTASQYGQEAVRGYLAGE